MCQKEWEEFWHEDNNGASNPLPKREKADSPKSIVAEDGSYKPSLAGLPPRVLEEMAEVMSFGAIKYYPNKWLTQPTTAFKRVDSALRHINKWLQKIDTDEESGKHHLAHALVQLSMAREYLIRNIEDGR